jgi:hypothetical protein
MVKSPSFLTCLSSFQPAPCFGSEFSESKTKGVERQTGDTQISPVFFKYFLPGQNEGRETIKPISKNLTLTELWLFYVKRR